MHRRTLALAACATAAAAVFSPLTASAEEPALAAPGGPMRMFAANPPTTMVVNDYGDEINIPPEASMGICSQGPIGTVRTPSGETHRVMLSAAHCFLLADEGSEPSGEVTVPLGESYVRIGELDSLSPIPPGVLYSENPIDPLGATDWAIIRVDDEVQGTALSDSRNLYNEQLGEPVQLTYIRDFSALAPGAVAFDNIGQPICKDGSTAGRGCGTQLARTHDSVYSFRLGYESGDSGGVNFDPRDGAIIGVSSVHVGPVSKAQTADAMIEAAYGVPDGQVNEYFTVEDSTAPHAEFTSLADDNRRVNQVIVDLNPELSLTDPQTELQKATDAAQQDAARLADNAARGEIDSQEIQQAVEHHSEQLSYWGGEVVGNAISQALL